ncbi:zinc finger protein Pegasus-like [Diaphorina citri]|uniref:Zinc finger protein Pegasus-like n=1 Tax=Diaphorina citri TaxID=121845 RepID=A0A3Q0J7Z2_DIACI|nr:zinc finger protein Pegasus-like [Diaphorina citri]
MKKHIRTHTGEKPFKCTHCRYSASRRDTLDHHIQVSHLYKKRFQCPVCDYRCTKKYNLQMHALTKHDLDIKSDGIIQDAGTYILDTALSPEKRVKSRGRTRNSVLPDVWSEAEIEDDNDVEDYF